VGLLLFPLGLRVSLASLIDTIISAGINIDLIHIYTRIWQLSTIVRNEEIDRCFHWKCMATYKLDKKREIIYGIHVIDMRYVCP